MTVPVILDPEAQLWLLTEDDWAPFLESQLRAAAESVFISVYMVSRHWKDPGRGRTNLLETLKTCPAKPLRCRIILSHPGTIKAKEPYNIHAAQDLKAAGWGVKFMKPTQILHEKTILIDNSLAIIGSHNISVSSMATNLDTSVAIRSEPFCRLLWRQFWARWRQADNA